LYYLCVAVDKAVVKAVDGIILFISKNQMMKRLFTLAGLLLCSSLLFSQKDTSYWTRGAGLGADFAQLLQINPRAGAGQNRLGLGGAINFFAKHKKDRVAWDNVGLWQFGVQRFGSGPLPGGGNIPFQKAIDDLRFSSKLGFQTSASSKFFYAADLNFISQITPTFQGPSTFPGQFLSNVRNGTLLSQLFAPATINLSLGIDYKPNDKFSFFYSPLGAKWVIVGTDGIARLGVHGNPVTKNAAGTVTAFENVDAQLGSLLRANYANKFMGGKLAYTSSVLLFSNYLREPQNIDLDWNNSLAMTIFKNIQLGFLLNAFYDHDMRMQITDFNSPNGVRTNAQGVPITGRRLSLTQQLLLKYAVTF
jgi:Protein of unknown function (DUF3078)